MPLDSIDGYPYNGYRYVFGEWCETCFSDLRSGFVIGITFGHAIAVSLTCLRLVVKIIKRRLWWNDFWAMISLSMLVAQWILTVEAQKVCSTTGPVRSYMSNYEGRRMDCFARHSLSYPYGKYHKAD